MEGGRKSFAPGRIDGTEAGGRTIHPDIIVSDGGVLAAIQVGRNQLYVVQTIVEISGLDRVDVGIAGLTVAKIPGIVCKQGRIHLSSIEAHIADPTDRGLIGSDHRIFVDQADVLKRGIGARSVLGNESDRVGAEGREYMHGVGCRGNRTAISKIPFATRGIDGSVGKAEHQSIRTVGYRGEARDGGQHFYVVRFGDRVIASIIFHRQTNREVSGVAVTMCWKASTCTRPISEAPNPGIGRGGGEIRELNGLGTTNRIGCCREIRVGNRSYFDRLCDLEGVVASGAGRDDQLHIVCSLNGVGVCGIGEVGQSPITQIPLITQDIVDGCDVGRECFGEGDTSLIWQPGNLNLGSSDNNIIRHDQGVFAAVLACDDQANGEGAVRGVIVGGILQDAGVPISEIPTPGTRTSGG